MQSSSLRRLDGKPKLLFVGAFPPPSSRVVGGNVSDCRALLASSFPDRFELILLDSTQASLPAPPLLKRTELAVARILLFFRLFEAHRPDAMLIFASSGVSFLEKMLFATYGRLRGTPSLFSIRSGHFMDLCRRSLAFRGLARLLLNIPARLLCQGEQWRRFFTTELGASPAKCAIVDNWVASNALLALAHTRTSVRTGPLHILFLGWIERFKGVFELIEAAALLRSDAQTPPFMMELAGEGAETAAVQSLIDAKGLGGCVQLKGLLQGDSKLAALERADIFVLPSYTEGLPNAMIEAMAAGLPVVVTPVGSVPDVIIDGTNGVLAPPRDAAALAIGIRRLIESPKLRATLGWNANESATTRFGTERAADALSSLALEIIRERQAS